MNNNRKIDEYGKLIPDYKIENSNFFNLLLKNDKDIINDWLLKNGHIKAYCPVRFLDEKENELYTS